MISAAKNQPQSQQKNPQITLIKPDEGYGRMTDSDNIATANLLGDSSSSHTTPYTTYRDQERLSGNSSSSSESSSSSSSSSSPDSEREGGVGGDQYDPFTNYKMVQNNNQAPPPTHSKPQGGGGGGSELLEDFFSNPTAGVEEANLLEFSTEEIKEEQSKSNPPSQQQQKQYDPFSLWETQNAKAPPTSSSKSTTSASSSSFDPFGMWEGPAVTTPTAAPATVKAPTPSFPQTTATSTLNFDPFAPSSSQANDDDILQFTTTTSNNPMQQRTPSTTGQTSFSMNTATSVSQPHHPMYSGYSGWASFTSTSSSSAPKNSRLHDPFGEIWSEASGRSSPQPEHRTTQSQKSSDPFSGLGNFGSGGRQHSQQPQARNPSPNHTSSMTNRPMYQIGNRGSGVGLNVEGGPRPGVKKATNGPSSSTRPTGGNGSRPRSVSPTPRYGKWVNLFMILLILSWSIGSSSRHRSCTKCAQSPVRRLAGPEALH